MAHSVKSKVGRIVKPLRRRVRPRLITTSVSDSLRMPRLLAAAAVPRRAAPFFNYCTGTCSPYRRSVPNIPETRNSRKVRQNILPPYVNFANLR
ncbi:hypothetical protein J6590_015122 [Homalodisca vitripennis]|nr:hypothetical protein J6590_015122 [Homalodisca vitripennis]